MNKNNLKSAIRNLRKKSLFAIVNIGGLTFGLLCALFIGTYVLHEFSYDKFYPDADRIYRTHLDIDRSGITQKGVIVPTGLKPYLDERIAQIEHTARFQRAGAFVFEKQQEFIKEESGFYTDTEFFDIFSPDLLEGDVRNVLNEPQDIAISETLSKKYFGNESPLGKSISIAGAFSGAKETYIVSGVFADFPSNSSLSPAYLFSIEKLRERQRRPIDEEWSNYNAFTFVKLHQSSDLAAVNALISDAIVQGNTGYDMTGTRVSLQAISDIHMQSFVAFGDLSGQVKSSAIFMLIGIGVLILSLVCINFFNLSTTRSLERAREIGVRKSIGASRIQLIKLYLSETALQVVFSLLLALILFEISGEYLGSLLGSKLSMDVMLSSIGLINFVIMVAGLVLILIFGAGFYPALVISGFKPVESLKGKVNLGRSGFNLGKSLLVIQFIITLSICIVASVIYAQVSYMEKANPGYDRKGVVSVRLFDSEKLHAFGEKLSATPLINSVTYVDDNIYQIFNSSTDYSWDNKSADVDIRVNRLSVANDFLQVMNIRLLKGRSFDASLQSDDAAVILNQTAAKLMGIDSVEDFPTIKKGESTLNVIGIVSDFMAGDFREENKPIVLYRNPGRFFQAYLRLNPENKAVALTSVEAVWKEIVPEKPFEYHFLEDQYQRLLEKDRQMSSVLLFFTGVSILISFIGLFGMIRLRVQNRVKELGIRKILGASFRQVIHAVSREFVLYLLLAVLVGVPLAVYTGNLWLAEFTNRISIGVVLPLLVIAFMSGISLVTLFFSTRPLTRMNLVETLKED